MDPIWRYKCCLMLCLVFMISSIVLYGFSETFVHNIPLKTYGICLLGRNCDKTRYSHVPRYAATLIAAWFSGKEESAEPNISAIEREYTMTKNTPCTHGCISNLKTADKRRYFKKKHYVRVDTSFHQRYVQRLSNQYPHYFLSKPIGRLGNMMFEFASSLGIARALKYKHIVSPSHPLLKYFNITNVMDINVTNVLKISEGQWRNKMWRADTKYMSFNLTLYGYFQSRKIFENASDEVRKAFAIQSHIKDNAKRFLDAHITGDTNTLVGIHIRRGDFLSDVQIKLGRVVASVRYIEKAKWYFRMIYKDPVFVVISNDKKWCKDNIADNYTIFSTFKDPIIDLAIMTLCHHAIISPGTFSWWCGWFSKGTVIYMKDHPRPGSPISRQPKFREGFHLPTWIGMTNN